MCDLFHLKRFLDERKGTTVTKQRISVGVGLRSVELRVELVHFVATTLNGQSPSLFTQEQPVTNEMLQVGSSLVVPVNLFSIHWLLLHNATFCNHH